MSEPPPLQSETNEQPRPMFVAPTISGVRRFISDYFWFILKNVVGWVFILGALPAGLAVPGPGGIPLFLIGFALVTFPGKRKLTSRVMRGVPVRVDAAFSTFLVTLVSILITTGLLWFVSARYEQLLSTFHMRFIIVELIGVCALAAGVTWLTIELLLGMVNFILRRLPNLRRKMRPWLRRKGIHFLPPRHKPAGVAENAPDELFEFDEKYSRNLRGVWDVLKPWLKRTFGVAITILIFVRMIAPIQGRWHEPDVQARFAKMNFAVFAIAAAMFTVFLFLFRAMVWRRILTKLGFRLPLAPAVRIWSMSELTRYVPVTGAIAQVAGRVYLVKPYGIRGSITSVSQILELTVFLLANVVVAVSCLLYFGIKNVHGVARDWMFVATLLVPVLFLLLHPRVCYGIINTVMRRLGKPAIANPLSGRQMVGILMWNVSGLIWQSVAVYLLTRDVLGLKLDWWWVVAGAYCLSWCAGFLAFWAPGGIGVRELVFVTAMTVTLPHDVQTQLGGAAPAVLVFLSFLLRLWTTTGELLLAAISYAIDYRGALGRADAPGRIKPLPS